MKCHLERINLNDKKFFSIHRSCHVWVGRETELLDSLWSTGYIRSLTQEKTKKRNILGKFQTIRQRFQSHIRIQELNPLRSPTRW